VPADIDLGNYKAWADADRIAINMARMYEEFSGTITFDQDFPAFHRAFRVDGAKRHSPYPDQRALTVAANASTGLQFAGRVGTAGPPAFVNLNLPLGWGYPTMLMRVGR
jgi:hypothetical protein